MSIAKGEMATTIASKIIKSGVVDRALLGSMGFCCERVFKGRRKVS